MMKKLLVMLLMLLLAAGLFSASALAAEEAQWGADAANLTGSGTLDQALAAVNGNASLQYIQLQGSVSSDSRLSINKSITLDLNGQALTANDGVTAGGDLTITDSSTAGNGSLTATSSVAYGVFAWGNITVKGGSISGESAVAHGVRAVGSITVEDGSLTGKAAGIGNHGVYAHVSLTVNGGSLSGESTGNGSYGVYCSNGDITVEGTGSLTATGIYTGVYANVSLTVNGGSLTGTGTHFGVFSEGSITIQKEGKVTATGNAAVQVDDEAASSYSKQSEAYDEATGLTTFVLVAKTTYTVTVTNGTGSGDYEEGASVTITASAPETGKQFAGWTGLEGLAITSGSANTASVTFTMPARAVTVTATYEDIPAVPGPVITSPTTAQSVTAYEGEPAALSIAAEHAVSYQWLINRNDGAGWQKCGENSPTYVSSPTRLSSDGFRYKCVVTGADEKTEESPIFTLKVLQKIVPPQTGDNAQIGLWLMMSFVSMTGMLAIALYGKKRKTE